MKRKMWSSGFWNTIWLKAKKRNISISKSWTWLNTRGTSAWRKTTTSRCCAWTPKEWSSVLSPKSTPCACRLKVTPLGPRTDLSRRGHPAWTLVCLSAGNTFVGYKAVVAGWGLKVDEGSPSDVLQHVNLPIMGNEDCIKTDNGHEVTNNMLCAGYAEGEKDACQVSKAGH